MRSSARTHTDPTGRPSWARLIIGVASAVMLVAAAGVVITKSVATSSARVSASTSTGGLLAAGTIAIERVDDSARLFLSADGLYPGRVVEGCVELDYAGSVPATLRLTGDGGAGTGLDRHVELVLDVLDVAACPSDRTSSGQFRAREIFAGRLDTLWTEHGSFADGVEVSPSVEHGDRVVLRARAQLGDDEAAAGLTTDFSLTIEARPR